MELFLDALADELDSSREEPGTIRTEPGRGSTSLHLGLSSQTDYCPVGHRASPEGIRGKQKRRRGRGETAKAEGDGEMRKQQTGRCQA